jgi:2-dehydro-3-deoxyphosphogluconate aldolase/(4S)-4-hydroxy-2-oxoglutarate aldolase
MRDNKRLLNVIEAICVGGVKSIEITMTVPGAVGIIGELVNSVPEDVIIGAGTVTDVETATAVIGKGARFVVGPILNLDVVKTCHEQDTVAIPGCFSPTEILSGWKAGADVIKVFPANSLGTKYLKDLRTLFPDIRLMPTGGVSIENVGEWVEAGAVAVGIGSDLLDNKAIEENRFEVLTERAKSLVRNFQGARHQR